MERFNTAAEKALEIRMLDVTSNDEDVKKLAKKLMEKYKNQRELVFKRFPSLTKDDKLVLKDFIRLAKDLLKPKKEDEESE